MIQHRVKLTDDTLIRCKLYPFLYAMREELRNEVDSMLEMEVMRPLMSHMHSLSSWLRRRMVPIGC